MSARSLIVAMQQAVSPAHKARAVRTYLLAQEADKRRVHALEQALSEQARELREMSAGQNAFIGCNRSFCGDNCDMGCYLQDFGSKRHRQLHASLVNTAHALFVERCSLDRRIRRSRLLLKAIGVSESMECELLGVAA